MGNNQVTQEKSLQEEKPNKEQNLVRKLEPLIPKECHNMQDVRDAIKRNEKAIRIMDLSSLEIQGSLEHGKINENDGILIGEALKINSTLTTLNLRFNSLKSKGARIIVDALKLNSTLTELNLSSNYIGEDAINIGYALQLNSTLTTLDLSSNNIGEEGASTIGDALKLNSTLTTLDLSYNYIGEEGVINIGDALILNSTLTTLSLNHVGSECAITIGDALKLNSTLTTLNLSSNYFNLEAAIIIVFKSCWIRMCNYYW
jgi:hypothetical protein